MKKQLFFYIIIVFSFACKHDSDSVPELTGKEYFPIDIGRFWIYDVSEIRYNGDTTHTTYQRKDVIHDSYMLQNVKIYELYRFYKANNVVDWAFQPDSVWSFSTNQNQISIKESNVEFIRLVFPLANGKTWDGNSKNTALQDDYIVSDFKKPYSVGNLYFPETANIVEDHSLNYVNKDYRNRIYANNIGLIYKYYERLTFNTEPGNVGQEKIEYGSIIEEKLIEYGTP